MTRRRLGWCDSATEDRDPPNLLVIGDDFQTRRMLARIFEVYEYRFRMAASMREAEAWLSDFQFDMVLLDIDVASMGGVEMLDWSLGGYPELPVILLVAPDDSDMAMHCLDKGARAYLTKPVLPRSLDSAIRDAIAVPKVLIESGTLGVAALEMGVAL